GRRQYDIHDDITRCDALVRVRSQHGTRLLPVAFAEGCPTHPSYPSAHACNAGACATVLKAFFDPDYVLPHPVESSADGMALQSLRHLATARHSAQRPTRTCAPCIPGRGDRSPRPRHALRHNATS